MNNNEILERIKKIRNLRGVKQEYIALQMGMSQSTYSKIENGNQKLTFEVIEKIADVLNIPINHLTQTDHILVLREGQLIEAGTHQQLLSQEGAYKQMWDKQIV